MQNGSFVLFAKIQWISKRIVYVNFAKKMIHICFCFNLKHVSICFRHYYVNPDLTWFFFFHLSCVCTVFVSQLVLANCYDCHWYV